MKNYTLLLLFFLYALALQAQENKVYKIKSYKTTAPQTFVLNGTIDKDTGTISLFTGMQGDSTYTATIDHGRFSFSGPISYPISVQLIARNSKEGVYYMSGSFYIEPGVQTIVCHKDSLREIPDIDNKTMRESKGPFTAALSDYNRRVAGLDHYKDSIDAVYGRPLPDSIRLTMQTRTRYLWDTVYPRALLAYTRQHPASYVAFWKLASRVNAGYNPVYDTIYSSLAATLKRTDAGRKLKKNLDGARTQGVGRQWSGFTLQDTAYKVRNVTLRAGAHKYTLVDFWESHCSPCKQQFAIYKTKYDAYKALGLEIIAISTDYTKDTTLWKKIIHDNGYPWPQYLDENAHLATSLSIDSYPRNFLLDEHNTIIMKDISPAQLDKILNK